MRRILHGQFPQPPRRRRHVRCVDLQPRGHRLLLRVQQRVERHRRRGESPVRREGQRDRVQADPDEHATQLRRGEDELGKLGLVRGEKWLHDQGWRRHDVLANGPFGHYYLAAHTACGWRREIREYRRGTKHDRRHISGLRDDGRQRNWDRPAVHPQRGREGLLRQDVERGQVVHHRERDAGLPPP